jgi:hypothetical protein
LIVKRLQTKTRYRLLPAPKSEPTKAPTIAPMSLVPDRSAVVAAPVVTTPRLTPEQVREKWWWFLTGMAIAKCAASVLAGAILAGVWEWDRNRDGIPDHLQQPAAWPWEVDAGK